MVDIRYNDVRAFLGQADWMFDEELDIHIPTCRTCSNGPLEGSEVSRGYCYRCVNPKDLDQYMEPIVGSTVRDADGQLWLHSNESDGWVRYLSLNVDAGSHPESWTRVTERRPVVLVRWGWDG